MKPSAYKVISESQVSSATSGTVVTTACPPNTAAVLITVETTSARVTFAGGAPSSALGQLIPTGAVPVLIPVGPGTSIKFASTSGSTASLGNLTFLS